ncbi:MAG: hypothetical protein JWM95_4009 [Gemmatimonadetes bacterium]|nr:hypothetical protein [Gemmatimonadota bacterium]
MATGQVKQPRRAERAAIRGGSTASGTAGSLPAIGLEAEFTTVVDGVAQKPEDVFGSPRHIVRGPLVHRTGRSYHLPTGGALYFDTGVIEIATPMIEIARGCGARGTRSLWESLGFLRNELDAWELAHGRTVRLVGFSSHYNVSFDVPASERKHGRSVEQLAYLLTYILAAPVMLLATNRESTGVGVRPRGNRIEITADFTPDAALMAATATLIVGIVREVMTWPSYSLAELAARGIPAFARFVPAPHSSRKGWSARVDCFPVNPFAADVNEHEWQLQSGGTASLREMAGRTTRLFWDSIRALGDPLSLQLIASVMRGRAPSLLELDGRPEAYDDVGRLCTWDDLVPITLLPRSRYERVLGHAIAGRRVRIGGAWHKPVGVKGWTHVVFRRERDGARRVRSLDDMLAHLDAWDRSADRRVQERRVKRAVSPAVERREEERRLGETDTLERRRDSDKPHETVANIPVMQSSDMPAPAQASPAARAKTESPLVIVSRI